MSLVKSFVHSVVAPCRLLQPLRHTSVRPVMLRCHFRARSVRIVVVTCELPRRRPSRIVHAVGGQTLLRRSFVVVVGVHSPQRRSPCILKQGNTLLSNLRINSTSSLFLSSLRIRNTSSQAISSNMGRE